MEDWVKGVYEEERKRRGIPLEIKRLNGNYYLYHSTSKYDRDRHGPKKVSEYIGRITEKGVVEANRNVREVYEYGNSELIRMVSGDIVSALKKHLPDDWESVYALSAVRLIEPVPLKSVMERWEKLYMSTQIKAHLSPNTLTGLLRDLGSASHYALFRQLMKDSKKLAFDLSSIFSRSENMNIAQKGHNADHVHIPQVNMALIFDLDSYRPVFLKPLDGSVRDVKSLRKVLEEVDFNGILVLDRGFFSYDLAQLMSSRMKFIMPLRRNSSMADYSMKPNSSFVYRERGILCSFKDQEGGSRVYTFQDQSLMAEESSNFIKMVAEGKKSQKDYEEAQPAFGKISMLTNLTADPHEIYLMYKQRREIEQAFDAMKNELENDKSYLSDDCALRGYFLISFISLYLYYSIFNLIGSSGLTDRLSVNDALLRFSRVYMIMDGRREMLSELPASVEKLDNQLGTNIFPKKL